MAKYGVFLGLNGNKISKLDKYKIVVIEPEEFSAAQVQKLKKQGKKVLAYLNVGSIEKSRSYYKKFKSITLGAYEGWLDERWVDISKAAWQTYTCARAKKWINAGYDGFYIDNLDVVEIYKKKNLYGHAKKILKAIRKIKKVYLMVNGADYFVNKCLADKDIPFNAIQQEEVFTLYENGKYKTQKTAEKKRLKAYTVLAARYKLDVYLLEYKPSATNRGKIKEFCAKYGMTYYCASSINLT